MNIAYNIIFGNSDVKMQQEKLKLSWNTYSDHLREMMKEMMTSDIYADVTLVCDDKKQLKAHRNILSACSPVFKDILQIDTRNIQPMIYLRGIEHSEMESILQFIYFGEASFYECRLDDLLLVAKSLGVRELSDFVRPELHLNIEKSKTQNEDHETTDEIYPEKENFGECQDQQVIKQDMSDDLVQQNFEHELELELEALKDSNEHQAEVSREETIEQFSNETNTIKDQSLVHYRVKNLNCSECDIHFKSDISLRIHIQSVHEGLGYNCNQCDMNFTSKYGLRRHIEVLHQKIKHTCHVCGKQFLDKDNLTLHIENKHEGVRYPCNLCDYKAPIRKSLAFHKKSVHEGVKHPCTECAYKATTKPSLLRHLRTVHRSLF